MQSEVAYRWYVCVPRGDEFHKASCPQHAGTAFQVAADHVRKLASERAGVSVATVCVCFMFSDLLVADNPLLYL